MSTAINAEFEQLCSSGSLAGPCSPVLLEEAEVELKVKFPRDYRDFLLERGAAVLSGVEIYGLPDPLKNDPPMWQNVVTVTHQLRAIEQAGSENQHYIPISDDGTGIYFFLDTASAPEANIVAVGAGVNKKVASDLKSFVVDFAKGDIQL